MEAVEKLFMQGGWVLLAISLLSVLAWMIILWKCFEIAAEPRGRLAWAHEVVALLRRGAFSQAKGLCDQNPSVVGRVLKEAADLPAALRGRPEITAPFLHSEALRMEKRLSFLAVIAAALPLLGLLGTVLGMVATFGSITIHGHSDPSSLADGVSQALITTQAGLVASLPILLLHRWLSSRIRRCVESAHLFAKMAESALSVEVPCFDQ